MPRLINRFPAYRHHKGSGQAVVVLNRRCCYLGKWKSPASLAEYDRIISEWTANGRQLPDDPADITIAEIVSAFREHAKRYYRLPDGRLSTEVENFDAAFRPLLKMFGKTSAGDFGPLRLTTVQNEMIRINWCRNQINKHTGRIRQLFKWSVSRELIPASVFQGLQSMSGLRIGRSEARESEPVKPVAIEHVDAVLPFLSPTVAAMVLLQLVRLATILNQSMN